MAEKIFIVMIDGRFIEGVAHAPGERVELKPEVAHEIVAHGWARFANAPDAPTARKAFSDLIVAQMRRADPQSRWSLPGLHGGLTLGTGSVSRPASSR